jgi:hypothetical protein
VTRLHLIAIGVAAVIIVAACSPGTTGPSPAPSGPASAVAAHTVPVGATAGVDDGTWDLAERVTAPSYTGDSTDAFKTALARAGIAVVADPSTNPATARPEVALTGDPSPVALLDFQAHALAVGAWAGATWTGAEFDGVVPVPADSGSPTLAQLLDGYVGSADTPAGALARALMAGEDLRDPEAVHFPAAVLFLFVSDVATDGGRLGTPAPGPSGVARLLPLAPADPVVAAPVVDLSLICSGPSGWIDAVVSNIESAITLAVPKNVAGSIITAAVNWLINTVASVVKTLINTLVGPVLSLIRGIAALTAGIAEQIASLLPYAVQVNVSGGAAGNFFPEPEPQAGAFDVQVSGGDLPSWPGPIATCARAAGISLPDFTTKQASTTFEPIVISGDRTPMLAPAAGAVSNTTTDDTGQAHWPFDVAPDPGAGKGTYTLQNDQMTVAVHRKELDELRASLSQALLGGLPPILRPYLDAILQPILGRLQDSVNKLLDARGHNSAHLWYHVPAASPAPPSISPSPSGSCSGQFAAGSYEGSLTLKSTTIIPPGQIDLGEHGGETGDGTAPLSVTVAGDGSLSGQFSLTTQDHFEAHGPSDATRDMTIVERGTAGGTLCSLTLRFVNVTTTACHGTGPLTCSEIGKTFDLSGLVPPEPLGAPVVSGKTFTWSFSNETSADAGFGGLSSEVQSTITVTLQGP